MSRMNTAEDLFELEDALEQLNTDLEELAEAFPDSRCCERLYKRFGFWEAYLFLDLINNEKMSPTEKLVALTRKPYVGILKNGNMGEVDEISELFREASAKFTSNTADGTDNFFYGSYQDPPKDIHYNEHLVTRIEDMLKPS